MRRIPHGIPALLCLALAAALTGCAASNADIALGSVRGYHIGGHQVTLKGLPVKEIVSIPGTPARKSDPNGDYQVGQMYVQEFRLLEPKARYPLLMWHGGGLTGATWEDTPDGRPGWRDFFMRRGHDTVISDAYERGRASWPRYPELIQEEPEHRTINQAWNMFRFGPADGYASDPAARRAYDRQQFPVAFTAQFQKQFVARWPSRVADERAQNAYNTLVEKACPCVILAHSQGNIFAFNAALAHPDKVKAVISLEPAGAPDFKGMDLTAVARIPHLVVWGDYIAESPLWQRYRASSTAYLEAIRSAGGNVDIVDLPAQGIRGNSHMIMMDRNADEVAELVQRWMDGKRLMKVSTR